MDEGLTTDESGAVGVAPTSSWLGINWRYATPILLVHLAALLALMPNMFSWTGVVLAFLGSYVFGCIGMNVGYHRLITHRGFTCPRWLECTLAVLGACCLEESPIVWSAWHRLHHHASDKARDPHSPLKSFLWGHIGWLFIESENATAGPLKSRYAPDLQRDPFMAWLERRDNWIKVALASWLLYFAAGYATGLLQGASRAEAAQFGASLVVWGCLVRTVLVWHVTWSVNSVAHRWGYRNYETPDNSRNNILIGFLAGGEGWHNNHHAMPSSARHGHKWWEFDLAWATIRTFERLGWAKDVKLPSHAIIAHQNAGGRANGKELI